MERYSYHALYETKGCGLLLSRLSNMSIPHLTILCHPSYNIKECRGSFLRASYLATFWGLLRLRSSINSSAYRARSKPADADKRGTLRVLSSR